MPALFFKTRFLIAIIFSVLLLAMGCKKAAEEKTDNILAQYFEQNVLNRDFRVDYAILDSATNLTANYTGYIFRLLKDTETDGPMTAVKNGTTYTGTWSCTEEFGKLNINLTQPTTPAEFNFLNRNWKFVYKGFPTMKLAPWGVAGRDTVWMTRL